MLAEVERQGAQVFDIEFEARTCPARELRVFIPKTKTVFILRYTPPCTRRCIPASVIIYEWIVILDGQG